MNGHGGSRPGAGRKLKWTFEQIIAVGHACESRWHAAETAAWKSRLEALPHAREVAQLQNKVNAIPLKERSAWAKSHKAEDHAGDIEGWLHKRAGNALDEETGTFSEPAPRLITLSKQPSRGTRTRIIAEVASQLQLPPTTVDNLWQAYRRIRRDIEADEGS